MMGAPGTCWQCGGSTWVHDRRTGRWSCVTCARPGEERPAPAEEPGERDVSQPGTGDWTCDGTPGGFGGCGWAVVALVLAVLFVVAALRGEW